MLGHPPKWFAASAAASAAAADSNSSCYCIAISCSRGRTYATEAAGKSHWSTV